METKKWKSMERRPEPEERYVDSVILKQESLDSKQKFQQGLSSFLRDRSALKKDDPLRYYEWSAIGSEEKLRWENLRREAEVIGVGYLITVGLLVSLIGILILGLS